MVSKLVVGILLIFVISSGRAYCQYTDVHSINQSYKARFKYKALIVPTLLIGYGILGMGSDGVKAYNNELKDEITENIDESMTIDDYAQYVPVISVYGLNAMGINGKNNFRDRTTILATSYLIMCLSVTGIKSISHVERPDGSTFNSFPSGHTATAFWGAQFLWEEYKDESIWYGISGYLVASSVGFFRMYNDRHWFTDVAAGAGIGILSTKIGYWVQPYISEKLFGKKETINSSGLVFPYYNGKQVGIGLSLSF